MHFLPKSYKVDQQKLISTYVDASVTCGIVSLSSTSINGCQLSRGRDGSLWIQSLVEFLISSAHLCPPYRQLPDGLVMTTTSLLRYVIR